MKLVRTRNSEIEVDFKEAVLNPSTDDNSLYAPKTLPKFNLKDLKNLSYKQFALKLIQSFEFDVDYEVFKKALDSYENFDDKDCPIYIFKASENLYINELYHGPTRAFKDMALQPFGVLLDELSKDKKFLILCATSGDTGPATLKAFENKDNIKVVCIYPHLGTSEIQALQMNTMQAKNLKVMPISGDFDTAQNILKTLLNDKNFSDSLSKLGYCLSVANSVNFARILFQTIYHYYVSLKLNKTIDIIVPSGNFGNALAAYYAKKMGANIDKIKIASNSNNILSDFFTKGEYDLRGRMLIKTISPAMDILISSNIERLMERLTAQEENIMLYIWRLGPCFIRDIVNNLPEPTPPYTSVASVVRNLEKKKYVTAKKFGVITQYTPRVRQTEYKRRFLSNVVRDYFTGSYKEMVSFFVRDRKLSKEDLQELMDQIEREE